MIKKILRFLLYSAVLIVTVLVATLAWFHNLPESWNDYIMVRSLSDEPVTNLISSIERHEDETGTPPDSLLDLYPKYFNEKPLFVDPRSDNVLRYFRYTRYPKGDGDEVTLIYNKSSDRERMSVTCNEYGKCASHNTHIDAVLEKYGKPDIKKTSYKRDWEIAAVFPTEHNLSSDDSYEYVYWRTKDYPGNSGTASSIEGWSQRGGTRDHTKYGVNQFFSI